MEKTAEHILIISEYWDISRMSTTKVTFFFLKGYTCFPEVSFYCFLLSVSLFLFLAFD